MVFFVSLCNQIPIDLFHFFHLFPFFAVEYHFRCRNPSISAPRYPDVVLDTYLVAPKIEVEVEFVVEEEPEESFGGFWQMFSSWFNVPWQDASRDFT